MAGVDALVQFTDLTSSSIHSNTLWMQSSRRELLSFICVAADTGGFPDSIASHNKAMLRCWVFTAAIRSRQQFALNSIEFNT
jgi:hypothetical protein